MLKRAFFLMTLGFNSSGTVEGFNRNIKREIFKN